MISLLLWLRFPKSIALPLGIIGDILIVWVILKLKGEL